MKTSREILEQMAREGRIGPRAQGRPVKVRITPRHAAAASQTLLSAIETGLTVGGGGQLREGFAVRSDDYERVWFVAAEIDGPGLEGEGDVGIWATNSPPDGSNIGLIFAVDGTAHEFSDWGAGPEGLSMSDHGASEALNCL